MNLTGKLTALTVILIMCSILFASTHKVPYEMRSEDSESECIEDDFFSPVNGSYNDLLESRLHGVRSPELSWFPLNTSLPYISDYYSIDFGDVNNDGNLDMVVGGGQDSNSDGIYCWIGDGNGGWIEQSNGLPTSGWCADVEVDDLNNDGNLDIACSGKIYIGDGGEGGIMDWVQQTSPGNWYGVALGDVDNNGTIDIVAGTDFGVKVWTSNGGKGGGFVWTDSSNGLDTDGSYWGVELGDVNNDGRLDIAAASHGGEGVRVWTGNGLSGPSASWTNSTGTGLPENGDYAQVRLGDANKDGKLDLAVTKDPGGVRFFKGNGGEGDYTWVEESNGLATSARHLGLSFNDVNNDYNLDLIAANYSGGGGIEVWLGDGGKVGSMDWTPAREGLPNNQPIVDICLGDVNNDGRIDIGASTGSDGVQVWGGNLPDLVIEGWTRASTGLPTGEGFYDVVFEDINKDGELDLAAASNSGLGGKV